MTAKLAMYTVISAVCLILAGCATSITSRINITPVDVGKTAADGISDVSLIGGPGFDAADTILCAQDGSCAIFGTTHKSFGETTDYFAAMQSPEKSLLWARTYGGTHLDELKTTIATADSGYLMLGESYSLFFTPLKAINPSRPVARPLLIKIDASGERKSSYIQRHTNEGWWICTRRVEVGTGQGKDAARYGYCLGKVIQSRGKALGLSLQA